MLGADVDADDADDEYWNHFTCLVGGVGCGMITLPLPLLLLPLTLLVLLLLTLILKLV